MDKKAKAIINEYHETRQKIRSQIAELESTERRFFQLMQDKLRDLEVKDTIEVGE